MRPGVHAGYRNGDYISTAIGPAGTAQGYIGECPDGYTWHVERVSCYSNGATLTNAVLELYVLRVNDIPDDNSKSGRQDVATGTVVGNGISDQHSPIIVPAGYFLVAAWSGLTNGDLVRLSTQIEVRRNMVERTREHGLHDWREDEKPADLRVAPVVVGDQVGKV